MSNNKLRHDTGKSWIELIDEHPLRHDIWMVLDLYNELNVTEITYYVKQSKSTVSRVLKGMKDDGLLLSRRGGKEKGEKIPPKFFRINPKFQEVEEEWDENNLPKEPEQIKNYYFSKINEFRKIMKDLEKRFEYLKTLLIYLEEQLKDIENIEQAKITYKEFLSEMNEPTSFYIRIDEKRYKDFLDLRIEYMMKLQKLLMEKELDEENTIEYFDLSLPYSAFFELNKKLKQK
ncbi:MAG: ArsR family transcriptional regulator [Candidatus Hermodarchaeota archaeon]